MATAERTIALTAQVTAKRGIGTRGSRSYTVRVRHDRSARSGWKAGLVMDTVVPVLIGAAILAFVILIFAASSAHGRG